VSRDEEFSKRPDQLKALSLVETTSTLPDRSAQLRPSRVTVEASATVRRWPSAPHIPRPHDFDRVVQFVGSHSSRSCAFKEFGLTLALSRGAAQRQNSAPSAPAHVSPP